MRLNKQSNNHLVCVIQNKSINMFYLLTLISLKNYRKDSITSHSKKQLTGILRNNKIIYYWQEKFQFSKLHVDFVLSHKILEIIIICTLSSWILPLNLTYPLLHIWAISLILFSTCMSMPSKENFLENTITARKNLKILIYIKYQRAPRIW